MTKRTQTRERRGIALILSALLLGVLIAFVGLAVDLGYWVSTRSQLQTAADLAALAGALDLSADSAEACARLNGLQPNEAKIVVEGEKVTISVERDAPAFFSRIAGLHHQKLTARAAARQIGGQAVLSE